MGSNNILVGANVGYSGSMETCGYSGSMAIGFKLNASNTYRSPGREGPPRPLLLRRCCKAWQFGRPWRLSDNR